MNRFWKEHKWMVSLLLALTMVCSSVFPAFAEQNERKCLTMELREKENAEVFAVEQAEAADDSMEIEPMEAIEVSPIDIEDKGTTINGNDNDSKETITLLGAYSVTPKQVQDFFNSKVGTTNSWQGYCLKFVSDMWVQMGFQGAYGLGSAKLYAKECIVSTSRDNIPIGADVFFDTGENGHIGVHVGDGYFVHAGSKSVIEKQNINDSYYSSRYMGWGWHRYVTVEEPIVSGYLDINGLLNGADSGAITPCGTADVYINGVLAANDVADFYQQYANGTSYEIRDIKASTGYVYNGLASGSDSLSGTVAAGTTRNVRLSFSTAKYSITWNNYDGTTLMKDTVTHGTTPAYTGTPVRKADDNYYYEFSGWEPAIAPATKNAIYTAKYNAIPIKPIDMTGWTLYEELPANARVTEEAWTYRTTKTETKTSSADTMDGWVKTKSSWKKTGSGTNDYADFPEGFDTGHSLYGQYHKTKLSASETATNRREVNTTRKSFIYWHWTNSRGWLPNDNYNVYICDYPGWTNGRNYQYFMAHELTDDLGHTDRRGTTVQEPYYWWVDDPNDGSWWWYRFNVYRQTYTDYVKENVFSRTIVGYYKSSEKVTPSSTITDVKHWAKYEAESGDDKTTGGGSTSGGGGSTSGGGGSTSGGGGSASGGGGAAGGPGVKKTAATGAGTFSKNWFADAAGVWRIKDKAGNYVTSAWLCDDAVAANGQSVWYLMNTDGTMLAAGLVQDNTGNYYSLEMNHNGYYGMLRYINGIYDGIYMEFSQKHDGTFGAITNQSAIDALKAKYGVTRFGIGNDRCVYTKSFE